MESPQEFYIVEIHRFSEKSKRLPPRRHVHSVHHTLQRAKFQAATLLRAAIASQDAQSVSGDGGGGLQADSSSNYVYLDGLSVGQVYSGYEVIRPGRAVLGIKFRRSTTYRSTPLVPKSFVTTGTAIVQPIVAISGRPSKIQLISNKAAEIDNDSGSDSTPELMDSNFCSASTARSSVSSASSRANSSPERNSSSNIETARTLGAIPELLERKGGRLSVYSLPALEVEAC